MPKKDTKPKSKAPTSDDEDPKPPTKSTGAIPKSHSYAGSQDTEAARGRSKPTTSAMSEDESEAVASGGVWSGRTRSSAKPQPEEGTMRSLFSRMRSKSKSKSPTKREKSKSKSPSRKGKRTKSPSPHRSLFGRKKSKSPTKRDPVEEEPEDEESSVEEDYRDPITPIQDLRNIMESTGKMARRALIVRPGPDTEELIEIPPDSSPLRSKADLYKENLGQLPDPQTCIELKSAKGSPVEDDLTNTSSLSFTSLVQGVQLDDDDDSLSDEASGGESSKGKKKK